MRLVAALVLAAGCSQIGGRPPVPRFTIDPEFIAEGDAHRTAVTFDASASADDLEDPTVPLEYAWDFDDPSREIVEGAIDEAVVVATFSGEHVVTVTVTVTDPDGLSARLSDRLGLTVAK
jgi:hypothetical protein